MVLVLETFFFPFSVNSPTAQRAFAMRSSLKVLQFPSVLFALTVHNAEAFAHIWLKCTQKLLSVFSPLLSFGTPNEFHLLVLTFFLAYIKDEYFYTLKSKKTYQDQTTRSIYEIQNKKFGLNLRNIRYKST